MLQCLIDAAADLHRACDLGLTGLLLGEEIAVGSKWFLLEGCDCLCVERGSSAWHEVADFSITSHASTC